MTKRSAITFSAFMVVFLAFMIALSLFAISLVRKYDKGFTIPTNDMLRAEAVKDVKDVIGYDDSIFVAYPLVVSSIRGEYDKYELALRPKAPDNPKLIVPVSPEFISAKLSTLLASDILPVPPIIDAEITYISLADVPSAPTEIAVEQGTFEEWVRPALTVAKSELRLQRILDAIDSNPTPDSRPIQTADIDPSYTHLNDMDQLVAYKSIRSEVLKSVLPIIYSPAADEFFSAVN